MISNFIRPIRRSVIFYCNTLLSAIKIKPRKRDINLKILFFATLSLLTSHSTAAEDYGIEGMYHMENSHPLAAQLLLREDGTYTAEVAVAGVGAKDSAHGIWELEGKTLTLKDPPSTQSATNLVFEARYERKFAQLEKILQHNKKYGYELARKNYVLDLMYGRYSPQPDIQPLYVYFEFSQGPSEKQLYSPNNPADIWLAYNPNKTLKKIGFSSASSSKATHWVTISPTSRQIYINLIQKHMQPMTFAISDEIGLPEAEIYPKDEDELQRVRNNYLITVNYDDSLAPPPIKPVDIYWQFQDNSIRQTTWTNSSESRLVFPYSDTMSLKKVGMRMKDEITEIQWFDISATGRWFYFSWKDVPDYSPDGLAAGFRNIQLTVEKNCLKFSNEDTDVCFHRQ